MLRQIKPRFGTNMLFKKNLLLACFSKAASPRHIAKEKCDVPDIILKEMKSPFLRIIKNNKNIIYQ